MNAVVLLRITAVIGFLFFLGHTMGAPWTPGNEAEAAVTIAALKAAIVPGMKATRTYWDFYFGFGASISVYLLALAAITWQTASLLRSALGAAQPFMATLFVCYAAIGMVAVRYFFFVPAAIAGVLCLGIALAWWSGRRNTAIV